MAKSLDGLVAVVTGGNSGIGAATVELFLKQGAKVVVLDIQGPPKEATDSGTDSRLDIKCNVAADDLVNDAIKQVVEKWKTVNILVNCAGIMDGLEPIGDTSTDMWTRVLAVNVTGPFNLIRACIPHLVQNKSTPGTSSSTSVIINICSTASIRGAAAGCAYTTSKHALLGLSRNTAWMYRTDGVRCNAVLPGGVDTNIMQNSQIENMSPVGWERLKPYHGCMLPDVRAQPGDIAETVLNLVTGPPGLTGAEVVVDYGWTDA